jgi:hypothetical protein
MSLTGVLPDETAAARPRWAAGASLLVAAGIAVLLQVPHAVLPDIGWLVVVAERLLAGDALYHDVVEVNPPLSVLLYLPVAFLHRATGLGLKAIVIPLMLVLAAAGVALSALILRSPSWRWPAAAAAIALVLPLGAFGQREHIALVALLPFLAALTARAEGARLVPALAVMAGLCGGLAMAVKPHFVLCGLLPGLYAAFRHCSWRALLTIENVAAGFVLLLYAALVLWRFPDFINVWLPILQDTYRPDRMPFLARLGAPGSIAFLALAASTLILLRPLSVRAAVTLLAALGFYLAAIEQGKMWGNHLYPALALAALALLGDALAAPRKPDRPSPATLLAAALGMAGLLLAAQQLAIRGATTMPLAATIRALGPEHPRLFAFSGAVAAGNPLTAEVEGVWVGRMAGQWLWEFSHHWLEKGEPDAAKRARLERYLALDRDWARRDFTQGRPDFVLIDTATFDWLGWARQDPEIAAALMAYEPVDESAGVTLWARRDRSGAGDGGR